MNAHQIEAIKNANAHLNNAGLPQYTELSIALEKALMFMPSDSGATEVEGPRKELTNLLRQIKEEQYVVVDGDGRFYTQAGNETWSFDEDKAEVFATHSDAQAIAKLENAMVVPSRDSSCEHFSSLVLQAA